MHEKIDTHINHYTSGFGLCNPINKFNPLAMESSRFLHGNKWNKHLKETPFGGSQQLFCRAGIM